MVDRIKPERDSTVSASSAAPPLRPNGPSICKWPAIALVAWTLFVWGGRLRNLAIDPEGLANVSRWSLVASVLFTTLGLVVAVLLFLGRPRPEQHRMFIIITGVLAALSTLVWVVRGIDIALGDHEAAFIAVHTVLAVVSIGLSAWVMMSIRKAVGVDTGPARYHQPDG